MALTRIEVIAQDSFDAGIAGIAKKYGTLDYHGEPAGDDGRRRHLLLIGRGDRQALLDALQGLLGKSETARIVISTVQATVPPEPDEPEEEAAERKRQAIGATREELYHNVAQGADLNSTFLLQVVLSTVVATIGLLENSVAVVIGAMVIAPLLGPNLAFSFGAALGDGKLMLRALTTGLSGLLLAAAIGAAIGFTHLFPLGAPELVARTYVGLDGIALALASGAAAVLSIMSGLSSALVGVMVAVALLPPTAAAGIMLGGGQPGSAAGALLLLVVNVASVNLAALLVFLLRGVRPRRWLERKTAQQSAILTALAWILLLALLAVLIVLRGKVPGT